MSLPPRPQMTSRPGLPVSVSLRSVPRIVHAGDEATAVVDMRRAAVTAPREISRGLVSIRAMPPFRRVGGERRVNAREWTTVGSSATVAP